MPDTDTIAAVATPPGRGGIGIVRVSGPAVPAVARALLGRLPAPRRAALHAFRGADGEILDRGIALYFEAPGSYTGEAVLELQGHGGPVVLDRILARILALGARPARPGEFTERAFLNHRLDLAQAEAVADLIDASSVRAARSALRSLDGGLSRRVEALVDGLLGLRAHIEAAIDFPEDELDLLSDPDLGARLTALAADLEALRDMARVGRLLREGASAVIAGRPNVGKSSLLNRLCGRDAAIVTEIPGTTRDTVRESIDLDGIPLHLVDTAGLRASDEPVERIGIERARAAIAAADLLLLVVEDDAGPAPEDEAEITAAHRAGIPVVLVRNKTDLSGGPPGRRPGEPRAVGACALGGDGIPALRALLAEVLGAREGDEGVFMARRRHLEALDAAADLLAKAGERLAGGDGELAAEELRLAQEALGTITGTVTTEDLLGRIFSSFCIGK